MRLFTIALLLPGCGLFGPSMVGDWDGTCEIQGYEIDVEFEVEEDNGGDLEGSGSYEFVGAGYAWDGDLSGDRDGADVELTMEGEYGGYSIDLDIEGELDGDDLEGDCKFGSYSGDFEGER